MYDIVLVGNLYNYTPPLHNLINLYIKKSCFGGQAELAMLLA